MCVNNAIAFVKQFTLKEPSGVELKLICFRIRPDLWKHTLPHLGQTQRSNTHLSKKYLFLNPVFKTKEQMGHKSCQSTVSFVHLRKRELHCIIDKRKSWLLARCISVDKF